MKERDEAMKQQNESNATAQGMYVNAPAGVVPAQLHHGVGLPPCLGVPEAPGL